MGKHVTEERRFYIYAFRRPDSGAICYVGKGQRLRWRTHLRNSSNVHLARLMALAAAAGQEMSVEFLCRSLTNEEACEIECATIAFIGRDVDGGTLVNVTTGGEGVAGFSPTAATRAKMGAAHIGHRHTPEAKAQISATRRANGPSEKHLAALRLRNSLPMSDETRARISVTMTGKVRAPCSAETRAKRSAAQKGKPRPYALGNTFARDAAQRRRLEAAQ